VEAARKAKLAEGYGLRAKDVLEKEFRFRLSEETVKELTGTFGIDCAKDQFAQIIEFMTGRQPTTSSNGNYTPEELNKPGEIKCMILI
jgi:hypothetical protein